MNKAKGGVKLHAHIGRGDLNRAAAVGSCFLFNPPIFLLFSCFQIFPDFYVYYHIPSFYEKVTEFRSSKKVYSAPLIFKLITRFCIHSLEYSSPAVVG